MKHYQILSKVFAAFFHTYCRDLRQLTSPDKKALSLNTCALGVNPYAGAGRSKSKIFKRIGKLLKFLDRIN